MTNNDTVSNNTVCGNDGAGIILFDSTHGTVSGNEVFCKSANCQNSLLPNGEIVLASSLDLTADNTIPANTFVKISAYVPMAFVDGRNSISGNLFAGNLMENFGALPMSDWTGIDGGNGAWWRTVKGGSDWIGGVPQGASNGAAGSNYAFDFLATLPFGSNFLFPWRSVGADGEA